jgi:hypothetical protein
MREPHAPRRHFASRMFEMPRALPPGIVRRHFARMLERRLLFDALERRSTHV